MSNLWSLNRATTSGCIDDKLCFPAQS